jgi:hypothetical protein
MRGIPHQVLRLSVAALLAACVHEARPIACPAPADEILILSVQIQDWRREMGPACDPVRVELLGFARPLDPFSDRLSCEPDDDACALAEAMCDNAEQICQLAGARGNDVWSNEKCVSGKRACRDARACIVPSAQASR